jgi:hypothetical protein
MTKETFETKIHSDDTGLQIWLVTHRTLGTAESTFKIQFFDKEEIRQNVAVNSFPGYIDSVKKLKGYLLYVDFWGVRMQKPAKRFKAILANLIENGTMREFITTHNRKTRHLPKYIRRHSDHGNKHTFDICRPVSAISKFASKETVTVSLFKNDSGSWLEVKATLYNGNANLGIVTLNELEVVTPSSISNELFKHLNSLFDKLNSNIPYRKKMVARIRKYFDESHHAFVHLCEHFNLTHKSI